MGPKFSQQAETPDGDSPALKVLNSPIIMTKIARHLQVQDLLSLRLTCKLWNSSFIPEIRKRHTRIGLDLTPSTTADNDESVEQFLEVMKSSDEIPFSKYRLVNCRGNLQGFGAICGETMFNLVVNGRQLENVAAVAGGADMRIRRGGVLGEMLVDLGLPQGWFDRDLAMHPRASPTEIVGANHNPLPNLKQFSFFITDNQVATECSELVSKLIMLATELECLSLRHSSWLVVGQDHETYQDFLHSVFIPICDFNTNVHKLKHLQLGPVNRSILQILLELATGDRGENCLRLKSFLITVTRSEWEPSETQDDMERQQHEIKRMLKEFLMTQAPTLKELEIVVLKSWFFGQRNNTIPILLPRMELLETLKITHRYPDDRTIELSPGSIDFDLQYDGETFASSFPALTKLEYPFRSHFLDPAADNLVDLSHPGVMDLTMEVKLEDLALLSTRYPSITHLELRMDLKPVADTEENRDALSSIWTMWPASQLTHLTLDVEIHSDSDAVWPDELLTGVGRHQMADLRLELEMLNFMPFPAIPLEVKAEELDSLGELLRKYKTRPGISDLSQLQEFNLGWWPYDEDARPVTVTWDDWWSSLLRNSSSKELTEISVLCGLALIGPQLKWIGIDSYEDFLSDSSWQATRIMSVSSPNAQIYVYKSISLSYELRP